MYTSFGETWYKGVVLSASKRLSHHYQFLASYTLSKAEDTSTDFTSGFLPQNNGRGRNPADFQGLPILFDPDSERGLSLQNQRHHLVLSGTLCCACTASASPPSSALRRAGRSTFWQVLISMATATAARFPVPIAPAPSPPTPLPRSSEAAGQCRCRRRLMCASTRQSRLAVERGWKQFSKIFNLANRTNFTDINNVFGVAAYPSSPLPTYGEFQQAAPPRQGQLALKVTF